MKRTSDTLPDKLSERDCERFESPAECSARKAIMSSESTEATAPPDIHSRKDLTSERYPATVFGDIPLSTLR